MLWLLQVHESLSSKSRKRSSTISSAAAGEVMESAAEPGGKSSVCRSSSMPGRGANWAEAHLTDAPAETPLMFAPRRSQGNGHRARSWPSARGGITPMNPRMTRPVFPAELCQGPCLHPAASQPSWTNGGGTRDQRGKANPAQAKISRENHPRCP